MSRNALAWRFARRELRGGLRGFAVFLACLTLGVAAIAAVGVINAGVIEALERDASALLGGDLKIDVSNLPLEETELAALTPAGPPPITVRSCTGGVRAGSGLVVCGNLASSRSTRVAASTLPFANGLPFR